MKKKKKSGDPEKKKFKLFAILNLMYLIRKDYSILIIWINVPVLYIVIFVLAT